MARRRKSRNSWFGEPKRHAKAARLGWSHRKGRGRKKSRNAGAMGVLSSIPSAAKSGFKTDALKRAGWIIGGNLVTTWTASKLMDAVSILKSSTFARVGTTLAVAGGVAAASKLAISGHSSDILTGGILSGLTRGLRELFPSVFGGMSDDLDGMGDYVDPRQIAMARNGIGDYVDPRQIATARNGINDYADFRQIQAPVKLDGLQDSMVAEEIAMAGY